MISLLVGLAVAAAPVAQPVDLAFAAMKTLVGEWRVADRQTSLRIRFSLTAGGSVVVENWERAGVPHSLTLYHRDGARLLATHYCAQGNQPRLRLLPGSSPTHLKFAFVDATNLEAGDAHLVKLSFELIGPNELVRREVYRQGQQDDPDELRLVRVR